MAETGQRAEEDFHSKMDQQVALVLRGKRVLLLKEILESLGYPDSHLVPDAAAGFRLSGWMGGSGIFISLPRPPKISFTTLLKSSIGLQQAVLKRVRSAADPKLNAASWEVMAGCGMMTPVVWKAK